MGFSGLVLLDARLAKHAAAALGRYTLFGEIAAGGMASVHLARLLNPVGFARTVAIKRLHPHLAKDPEFVAMLLDEARLAARIRHANVMSTLDVVSEDGELFLVMEYVAGESLARLLKRCREQRKRIPPGHAVAIVCGALEGLNAAHEAKSEHGAPLGIVHCDVSPQNIHLGIDGVARVLDFGIAKATLSADRKSDSLKGKVAYMPPEQIERADLDRRCDVYAASVVLWEALTGMRLFKGAHVTDVLYSITRGTVHAPSKMGPRIPPALDAIVLKGLSRNAKERWPSAREMAIALERAIKPSSQRELGEWLKETAGEALTERLALVERIESETSMSLLPPLQPSRKATGVEVESGVMRTSNPSYPEASIFANDGPLDTAPTADEDADNRLTVEAPSSRDLVAYLATFLTTERAVWLVVAVACICVLVTIARIIMVTSH